VQVKTLRTTVHEMPSPHFPERSWLLDRHELFEIYQPDVDQPFPPECGIRVIPAAPGAVGHRDFVLLDDGLAVIASNVRYTDQVTIEHPDRPLVKFHYRLTGSSSIDFAHEGVRTLPEHVGSVLFMPVPLTKREIAYAGKHEQSITVVCTPQWLAREVGDDLSLASPELAAYAAGRQTGFFRLPITMRSTLSQAASALLQCELTGTLRRLYFRAKAAEIVALSLDVMASERERPEHVEHRVSQADFEQLREARRILQTELASVVKVAELAARVGMNESRMMQLFKRLFGETVFDFSQRVRMEFAAKLLEATDRSITDIAFEVGYDYPSNFTTAFKRHFGVPPRSVRAGGAALSPPRG
jgi:AraC-like DNA-binding protein